MWPDLIFLLQIPVIALIGNDAGWTQISREQVPRLGSNVACDLAYTGEGSWHSVGEHRILFQAQLGFCSLGLALWWAGSLSLSDPISSFRLSQSSHRSGSPGLAAVKGE